MNTLIIFNATAKRARFLKNRIKNQLRLLDIEGRFVEVHKKGEATKIVSSALDKNITSIIAIGGDGLIHDIVQQIVGTHITLAIIPIGKTNLLAHMLGIHDWKTGCLTLKNGEQAAIDVGSIDDHYFTSSVEIAPKIEPKKTLIARMTQKEVGKFYPGTISVSSDQNDFSIQTDIASISISPHPFKKGGISFDFLADQLLHIMVKSRPVGTHKRPVNSIIQGNKITVDTKGSLTIWADGEQIGKTPATITVIPEGLRVVRKKG